MRELTDDEVFAAEAPRELTDEEVFSASPSAPPAPPAPEMSDADVFGSAPTPVNMGVASAPPARPQAKPVMNMGVPMATSTNPLEVAAQAPTIGQAQAEMQASLPQPHPAEIQRIDTAPSAFTPMSTRMKMLAAAPVDWLAAEIGSPLGITDAMAETVRKHPVITEHMLKTSNPLAAPFAGIVTDFLGSSYAQRRDAAKAIESAISDEWRKEIETTNKPIPEPWKDPAGFVDSSINNTIKNIPNLAVAAGSQVIPVAGHALGIKAMGDQEAYAFSKAAEKIGIDDPEFVRQYAVAYGIYSAPIEYTEQMINLALGGMGKQAANQTREQALRKLVDTPLWKATMKKVGGILGEGGEELAQGGGEAFIMQLMAADWKAKTGKEVTPEQFNAMQNFLGGVGVGTVMATVGAPIETVQKRAARAELKDIADRKLARAIEATESRKVAVQTADVDAKVSEYEEVGFPNDVARMLATAKDDQEYADIAAGHLVKKLTADIDAATEPEAKARVIQDAEIVLETSRASDPVLQPLRDRIDREKAGEVARTPGQKPGTSDITLRASETTVAAEQGAADADTVQSPVAQTRNEQPGPVQAAPEGQPVELRQPARAPAPEGAGVRAQPPVQPSQIAQTTQGERDEVVPQEPEMPQGVRSTPPGPELRQGEARTEAPEPRQQDVLTTTPGPSGAAQPRPPVTRQEAPAPKSANLPISTATTPATAPEARPIERPVQGPEVAKTGETGPVAASVEAKAEAVKKAADQTETDLTAGQRESGRYPKGTATIHGLKVAIETPAGEKRRPEWPALKDHYGFVRGTEDNTGEGVDIFINPERPESDTVYVISQKKKDGSFDEWKVVAGATSPEEARQIYERNYAPGWQGFGGITAYSPEQFKKWVKSTAAKRKPKDVQTSKEGKAPLPRRPSRPVQAGDARPTPETTVPEERADIQAAPSPEPAQREPPAAGRRGGQATEPISQSPESEAATQETGREPTIPAPGQTTREPYPTAADENARMGQNPFPKDTGENVPEAVAVQEKDLRDAQPAPIAGHKVQALGWRHVRGIYGALSKFSEVVGDMFYGAGTLTTYLFRTSLIKGGKDHIIVEYDPLRATQAKQIAGENYKAVADAAEQMVDTVNGMMDAAANAVKDKPDANQAVQSFANWITSLPKPAAISDDAWTDLKEGTVRRFVTSLSEQKNNTDRKKWASFARLNAARIWSESTIHDHIAEGQDLVGIGRRARQIDTMQQQLSSPTLAGEQRAFVEQQLKRLSATPAVPKVKDTPEAAAFGIVNQLISGSQYTASLDVRADGSISPLFTLVQSSSDGKVPGTDTLRARITAAHRAMQGNDVRQADSWTLMGQLAEEHGPKLGLLLDPSYFQENVTEEDQAGVNNYNVATNIRTPRDLLSIVDTYLLPAWDKGAKMVLTNNYDAWIVGELRKRGFNVLQFTREKGGKAKAEFIAWNFNTETGALYPPRTKAWPKRDMTTSPKRSSKPLPLPDMIGYVGQGDEVLVREVDYDNDEEGTHDEYFPAMPPGVPRFRIYSHKGHASGDAHVQWWETPSDDARFAVDNWIYRRFNQEDIPHNVEIDERNTRLPPRGEGQIETSPRRSAINTALRHYPIPLPPKGKKMEYDAIQEVYDRLNAAIKERDGRSGVGRALRELRREWFIPSDYRHRGQDTWLEEFANLNQDLMLGRDEAGMTDAGDAPVDRLANLMMSEINRVEAGREVSALESDVIDENAVRTEEEAHYAKEAADAAHAAVTRMEPVGPAVLDDPATRDELAAIGTSEEVPYQVTDRTRAYKDAAGWHVSLDGAPFRRLTPNRPNEKLVIDDLNERQASIRGGAQDMPFSPKRESPSLAGESINDYDGSAPSVDWNAKDIQITGVWSEESVRKFLDAPKDAVIYRAMIPLSELDEKLAEREDGDFEEGEGYDWSELSIRRSSPPPVVVTRKADGAFAIADGNHRIHFWRNNRTHYDFAPAWVYDEIVTEHARKQRKRGHEIRIEASPARAIPRSEAVRYVRQLNAITRRGMATLAGEAYGNPELTAAQEAVAPLGIRIIPVKAGQNFNAAMDPNDPSVMYVNMELGEFPLLHSVGHEAFEVFRARFDNGKPTAAENPYLRLTEVLRGMIVDYDKARTKWTRWLAPKKVDDAWIQKEMMSDLMGENFQEPKFWQAVWEADKTLFENLIRIVKAIIDRILATGKGQQWSTKPHFRDLEAARAELAKIYVAMTKGDFEAVSIDSMVEALSPTREKPVFFSQVERTVENAKQPKAPGDQWWNWVKAQPAVKQEELEWLGLKEFLSDKKSVTRDEILDFIRANKIEVREVVKGGETLENLSASERTRYDELVAKGAESGVRNLNNEEINEWRDLREKVAGQGKFASYQLPGGQNYRELLLTLPYAEYHEALRRFADEHNITEIGAAERAFQAATGQTPLGSDAFRSSHWSEPNVIAHVRFNERTDSDSKRVLFIEEVQSDWHQKGREQGYASNRFTLRELSGQTFEVYPTREAAERDQKIEAADDHELTLHELAGTGIPDAPFKTTWPLLAMKRVLRWAAENGFDSVAWTPGSVQADRYDLSKQVQHIAWEKNDDGTYNINAPLPNGQPGIYKEDLSLAEVKELVGKDVAKQIEEGKGRALPRDGGYREWTAIEGENLRVGNQGMAGFYDVILPAEVNKYVKKWGGRVGETAVTVDTTSRVPELKPFGRHDEDSFGGADPFADGSKPLISASTIAIDGKPVPVTVIVSGNGIAFVNVDQAEEWHVIWSDAVDVDVRQSLLKTIDPKTARRIIARQWPNPDSQLWKGLRGVLGTGQSAGPYKAQETVHSLDITPSMKDAAIAGQPLFSPRRDIDADMESIVDTPEIGQEQHRFNKYVMADERLSSGIRFVIGKRFYMVKSHEESLARGKELLMESKTIGGAIEIIANPVSERFTPSERMAAALILHQTLGDAVENVDNLTTDDKEGALRFMHRLSRIIDEINLEAGRTIEINKVYRDNLDTLVGLMGGYQDALDAVGDAIYKQPAVQPTVDAILDLSAAAQEHVAKQADGVAKEVYDGVMAQLRQVQEDYAALLMRNNRELGDIINRHLKSKAYVNSKPFTERRQKLDSLLADINSTLVTSPIRAPDGQQQSTFDKIAEILAIKMEEGITDQGELRTWFEQVAPQHKDYFTVEAVYAAREIVADDLKKIEGSTAAMQTGVARAKAKKKQKEFIEETIAPLTRIELPVMGGKKIELLDESRNPLGIMPARPAQPEFELKPEFIAADVKAAIEQTVRNAMRESFQRVAPSEIAEKTLGEVLDTSKIPVPIIKIIMPAMETKVKDLFQWASETGNEAGDWTNVVNSKLMNLIEAVQSRRRLNAELEALGSSLPELIRQHFSVQNATIDKLVDAIIARHPGIQPYQAWLVAKAVRDRVNVLAGKEREAVFNRILKERKIEKPNKRLAPILKDFMALANMGALTRTDVMNAYLKKKGAKTEWTAQDVKEGTKLAKAVKDAKEGTHEYMEAIVAAERYILNKMPREFWPYVGTYRVATIFWGLSPHMNNAVGTMLSSISGSIVDVISAPGATIGSVKTGLRALLPGLYELAASLQGRPISRTPGKIDAPTYIPEATTQWNAINKGWNAIAKFYILPLNLMTGMDMPSGYKPREYMTLYLLAYQRMRDEGKTVSEAWKSAYDELWGTPEEQREWMKQAKDEVPAPGLRAAVDRRRRVEEKRLGRIDSQTRLAAALEAALDTLNHDNNQNSVAGQLAMSIRGLAAKANKTGMRRLGRLVQFQFLFTKIAANMIDMDLAGLGVPLMKRETYNASTARERLKWKTAATVAWSTTIILTLLSWLDREDDDDPDKKKPYGKRTWWISAGGPKNPKERAILSDLGWRPFTIKIGDRFYQYQKWPYLAFPLTLAGFMMDSTEPGWEFLGDDATWIDNVAYVALAGSGSILNFSFMSGTLALAEAMTNAQREGTEAGQRYIAQQLMTLVPGGGALRTVSRWLDPTIYESKTMGQMVLRNLGITSLAGRARLNIRGEPIQSQVSDWGHWLRGITYSEYRPDPTLEFLLQNQAVPVRPEKQQITEGGPTMEEAQYYEWYQRVQRQVFKELDEEFAKGTLQKITDRTALKKHVDAKSERIKTSVKTEMINADRFQTPPP